MKNSIFFPTRRNVLAGLGAVTGATALSSCYSAGTNSKHYDTIIIGAGLSGLNAARILESEGASLLILESSNRMGGRLMTLDDVINKP
ncbi:MAG: NAD(P)-binding protein, partial [Candidatus Omnitrophica bacterium]|nr:NAD(P)-binding protein [Candidatus Omnitrophota bacterium]